MLLGNLTVFQSLERDEAQGLGAGWGGLISVAGGQSDFLETEQKGAVVGHLKNCTLILEREKTNEKQVFLLKRRKEEYLLQKKPN